MTQPRLAATHRHLEELAAAGAVAHHPVAEHQRRVHGQRHQQGGGQPQQQAAPAAASRPAPQRAHRQVPVQRHPQLYAHAEHDQRVDQRQEHDAPHSRRARAHQEDALAAEHVGQPRVGQHGGAAHGQHSAVGDHQAAQVGVHVGRAETGPTQRHQQQQAAHQASRADDRVTVAVADNVYPELFARRDPRAVL